MFNPVVKTIVLITLITLVSACGPVATVPTASPVPATPVPPTATPIPPTPVPTALPGTFTVAVPPGNPPTLDGVLSPGEWDSARREKFSDGSELLLMQNEGYLYLGIRANTEPPEGLQGNQCVTMWSVFLDRGDEIAVLHSSAALGTAVYKRAESGWQRTRTFAWALRDRSNSEAARQQRKQFLEREGWLASLCAMGKLEETEFQLAMPQGSLRLAVAFPLPPSYDKAALWPAGLDDVHNIELLEGNAPAQARFSPERWAMVMVAGYETAGPAPAPASEATPVPPTVPTAILAPGNPTVDLVGVIKADNLKHLQSLYTLTGYAIAFSPKDPVLATGGLDGSVKVWNLGDGSLVQDLAKLNDMVFDLAYSPDSTLLAGAAGGKVYVLDTANGQVIATQGDMGRFVQAVAFSPDGRLLAAGGSDAIRVWNTSDWLEVAELHGHEGGVFDLAFTPDGTRLVSSCGIPDSTVIVWDIGSYTIQHILNGHGGDVHQLALSPDGKFIVSGGTDRSIRKWDLLQGKYLRGLTGFRDVVYGLGYSPSGDLVAAGCGSDGSIVFWDAGSGKVLHTLYDRETELRYVVFSPDGAYLASSNTKHQVVVWGVGP